MAIDITALLTFGLPGLVVGLCARLDAVPRHGQARSDAGRTRQGGFATGDGECRGCAAGKGACLRARSGETACGRGRPAAPRKGRAEGGKHGTPPPADSTPSAAPLPGIGWKAGRKLPTFLEAPIGPTDDLSLLKGVGPRLAARLREIGIFYFAQIADWSPEEVKLVDAKLDNFRGRIEKDHLIEQAKLLASGRLTEYEARFGKLGSD